MRSFKFSRFLKLAGIVCCITFLLNSCSKSVSNIDHIQQGNTVIQINAIYASIYGDNNFRSLQIRYNDVIESPIFLKIRFELMDGNRLDLPVTLPAGYQHLEQWYTSSSDYLNILNYVGGTIDTVTGTKSPLPSLSNSLNVKSLTIISATTPDPQYGFKVLGGNDDWTYYHPSSPRCTVKFLANNENIQYSGFDFEVLPGISYGKDNKRYHFVMPDYKLQIISDVSTYPVKEGMQIGIPFLRYYYNNRNYGYASGEKDEASNGSTLKLTVTKVNDQYFDATFSGKVWSAISPDTLFITDGTMENMPMPSLQTN